jgi:hypothetical protein
MRNSVRRLRFYVFGFASGRLTALGGFQTDTEANNAIDTVKDWDSEPEIKKYFTVSLSEAKKQYKFERSQKTGMLGDSLRPIYNANPKKENGNYSEIS